MRSRSLIQESTSPSVCAFCAHQLGQARRLSHVQRRFLQSSRPASRPPAEGAALQEDGNNRDLGPQAASWSRPTVGVGRGNGLGPGNGAAPGWGRGPGLGRGMQAAGGSWGKSNGVGIPDPPGAAERAKDSPAIVELLPHEQRARDLMLNKKVKSEQRPITFPRSAGPESNRAGRPIYEARTAAQHAERARSALVKRNALEADQYHQMRRSEAVKGAPPTIRRITRHVMGEGDTASLSWGRSQPDHGGSNWGHLRKRNEEDPNQQIDPAQLRERNFAEGRAQREEQSRFGRYTPLGSRSVFGSNRDQDQRQRQPAQEVSRDDRSSGTPSAWRAAKTNHSPTKESYATDTRSVEASRPVSRRDEMEDIYTVASDAKAGPKMNLKEDADEEEQREREPTRERKNKKKRGKVLEAEPSYGKMARGKDRDKAKRRQQFSEEDAESEEAARQEALQRAELKKQRKLEKAAKKPVPIMLPEFISVSNLAIALRVRQEDFIAKMKELGFEELHHDFILTSENAGLIAMEYNFEPIIDRGESEDLKAAEQPEDTSHLPSRPPVVTIMGHVDHGKTTILDYLRKSSVAASEHGGITQHIGAFSVPMPSGKTITFLDTPGHEAFLSMRQRGANVTDIVILVVAADDSVKPQTIEAINHAKAANVPIIVAINKIDKEDSDIEKVKLDLARHGVDVEDFGGDTQVVCVSGKTGQGMDKLEEAAVALTDILDMRADDACWAEGWVIEASIKSTGKCATVLVRQGTMRPGDFIVAGSTWARIRCLRNEAGNDIEEAGPGTPVEIDGWREQPLAGDEVLQAVDEGKAKSVVDYRLEKMEREKMAEDMEAINESRKVESDKKEREKLEAKASKEGVKLEMPEQTIGGPKEVYFIVKGDVSGSVEAVIDSISNLGNKEVHPHILRSGVGQLSEFDIEHASAANGHVINFNTEIDPHIVRAAEAAKVKIIDQNIIYRLVDEVKAELSFHLPPLVTQRVLGEAEISQVFSITVKGRQIKNVAGCKVRNGTIAKNAKVRVLRKGEKIYDGALLSLKNVKRDVPEMKKGTECGLAFEEWADFQVGDQIQTYDVKEEKRYL